MHAVADEVWIQFAGQGHVGQRPGRDQDQLPRVLPGSLHQFDDAEPCAVIGRRLTVKTWPTLRQLFIPNDVAKMTVIHATLGIRCLGR
jgi:hypothetical protein